MSISTFVKFYDASIVYLLTSALIFSYYKISCLCNYLITLHNETEIAINRLFDVLFAITINCCTLNYKHRNTQRHKITYVVESNLFLTMFMLQVPKDIYFKKFTCSNNS